MRVFIFIVSVIGLTLGKYCPPPEALHPCTCTESWVGHELIECQSLAENFPLKELFDNVSSHVPSDAVFSSLRIEGTSLSQIWEGAVEHLKFDNIFIGNNPNLSYISPSAFNATRNVTDTFYLMLNNLTNEAPHERDIFDLINNFESLDTVEIYYEGLSSIPDNAFRGPNLKAIYMDLNQISRIGSRAFAGAPNLERLYLANNSIPSAGLPEDAFDGIQSLRQVGLEFNGMEFLEQKSFQRLLDISEQLLVGGEGCTPDERCGYERLYCDERADWICDNESRYLPKLYGYRCKTESGYPDIWDYCAGRNSSLPN